MTNFSFCGETFMLSGHNPISGKEFIHDIYAVESNAGDIFQALL